MSGYDGGTQVANIFLAEALRLASMGISVIPLIPGEKTPAIKSWEPFQERIATKNEITSWWSRMPKANVAIVTGPVSGLCVVDHDKYKSDYDEETALKYFPDDIDTPMASTPRGGIHQYFSWPEDFSPTIKAGLLPGIDFRGKGGYIVAPPSVNGTGRAYEWITPLVRNALMRLPDAYKRIDNSSIYTRMSQKPCDKPVTSVTDCDIWADGKRDENLFHVALCLVKAGEKEAYTKQVLRAITRSWGEDDEKWIEAKIESAMKRTGNRERRWTEEVRGFIAVTSGDFSVTSCYNELQAVTKEDKAAVRQAIVRFAGPGQLIEKIGNRDGIYRKIESDINYITFDEDEPNDQPYPIILPLDLHEIVEISEGNIVLCAGEFNAGKTTFLMNVLQMNKNKMPIRYLSSEMGKSEFKKRFRGFGLPIDFWRQDEMTDYVKRSYDFHNVLKPDAINIIDYLEFRDADYTKGAQILTDIHDRLGKGVAIVAIQKKENQRLPRSGDLVLEKPRLAISFSKTDKENSIGVCEILKAKIPRLGNCDGKKVRFEITQLGSHFKVLNSWGYWR